MVLPLDMPDDYPWLPGSGKAQLGDMGELAVRLGSPVTYDRRGTVYWMDNFENGVNGYTLGVNSALSSIRYTHHNAFSGSLCCKMVSGSDYEGATNLIKTISPSILTTFGLEVTVSFDGDVDYFSILFQYNTATHRKYGVLQIDMVQNKLRYLNSSVVYADIADVNIQTNDPTAFHSLKLVVDLQNELYVRAMFDQNEYPITEQSLISLVDVVVPSIIARVDVESPDLLEGIAYIDNLIVSVGDP